MCYRLSRYLGGVVGVNLRNVDLNLLVALDALLTEQNVSRAGKRLGLSQSAMSGSLARLRKLFDDPLLVRVGRELTLTPAAQALVTPIRDILNRIEQTVERRPEFDPATAARTFSVSASDYATLLLLGPFLRALAAEAPGVTLHLLPRTNDARQLLRTGEVDLVIEPHELLGDAEFPCQPLFSDRWLCAVDTRNPHVPARGISREEYLRLPHLVYSIGSDRQLNIADQYLAQQGIQRRIEATVESFLLVPFLIQGTPLVTLVLERAMRRLAPAAGVRVMESPIALPGVHENVYWHPSHTTDPGHRWLRDRLRAAAAELERDG